MGNIIIRPASLLDTPALAKVHITSWQATYRSILPDEVLNRLSEDEFQTIWKQNLVSDQRTNLVLDVESHTSGFIAFGSSRDADADVRTGELYGFYLTPTVWKLGFGRKLWEEAKLHLIGRFTEVTLWVLQNNERARKFYEAVGFIYDGQVKKTSIHGVDLLEVRYRQRLDTDRADNNPDISSC
jgi:ribosomal protein S18 acetylase RimI-like enzyme